MRVNPRQRAAVRRASTRIGLDEPLRRLYERFEPGARRDRIDNEHLRLLIALCLAEDANCIDIGAHSGVILREIVRCAPRGRHIAYEPLPEFAQLLSRRFPAVDVRNAAVSNQEGRASFFRVSRDPMQSGLKLRKDAPAVGSEAITVRVERLDEALPRGYVPALIKIDVEGGERQVLEGAIQTISRHRPIVCVEHGPGAEREYETSPGDVYDLLVSQCGMRMFDIDGNGPYTREQFIDTYYQPIWNFVAHP